MYSELTNLCNITRYNWHYIRKILRANNKGTNTKIEMTLPFGKCFSYLCLRALNVMLPLDFHSPLVNQVRLKDDYCEVF